MSSPARNTTLLELHVPDFEPVKKYYTKLGFVIMRETKPDVKKGYLVIKMEENILCRVSFNLRSAWSQLALAW